MNERERTFWAALDEMPVRRGGGVIVGIGAAGRPERRSAVPRFPRREPRARRLELLGYLIERDERTEAYE
jgi:hypothetical protein